MPKIEAEVIVEAVEWPTQFRGTVDSFPSSISFDIHSFTDQ